MNPHAAIDTCLHPIKKQTCFTHHSISGVRCHRRLQITVCSFNQALFVKQALLVIFAVTNSNLAIVNDHQKELVWRTDCSAHHSGTLAE